MNKIALKISKIDIADLNPKEITAKIKITFLKNDTPSFILKEFKLNDPVSITKNVMLLVKGSVKQNQNDYGDVDELLDNLSVTNFINEESTEEKLLTFFQSICSKALKLKSLTDAKSYMKVIDEFKTTKFDLDSAPGSKVKINPTKPLVDPRTRFQPKIDLKLLNK